MLPYQVSNPGPLTYESEALSIALRGPARMLEGDNGGLCTMEPCVLERFSPQVTARLVSQQLAY